MDIPILTENDVPYVSTAQMIEVDRAMMEDYRIELIQMTEIIRLSPNDKKPANHTE